MNGLQKISKLISREQYLLNQFYSVLKETVQHVSTNLSNDQPASSEALDQLSSDLESEFSWSMANRIELALIDLYDDTDVRTEWQRRLAEVHRLPQHLHTFYQEHSAEQDLQTLRSLLRRLLADLQWQTESRRVARFNVSRMRKNIAAFFLCAFVVFFTPTIFRIFLSWEFTNLRIYYIFTAASSGLLGAAFSQLTSIQTRAHIATAEQLRAMSQWSYIIARSIVGAGAGLIMFYLMQSGLLSGAFFPEFIQTADALAQYQASAIASQVTHAVSQNLESHYAIGTLARPAQGLSLLIVWCLLAGFSEKMIPGILSNKAKQAEASSRQ